MNARELTTFFEREVIGYGIPIIDKKKTEFTIQYLLDSQIGQEEILNMLKEYKHKVVTPQNLPDSIWEYDLVTKIDYITHQKYTVNSNLVKRDIFYYHPRLMLRSRPPYFLKGKEIIEPYYCEPVCRFTLSNLIKYTADKINVNYISAHEIITMPRVQSILNILAKMSYYLMPIDILLYSIDEANSIETFMGKDDIIVIASRIIDNLDTMAKEMSASRLNKIIWRTDIIAGE